MAVTNKNIAYVRYDNTGRIVPGGPIVTSVKPKVGNWVAVSDVLTTTPNYKLRGFIRYIKNGDYVAGSLILQHDAPQDGNWKEVYVLNPACCAVPTTTTTTTITPSTTTTTTTVNAVQYDLSFICDPNGGFTNAYANNITGGTQPLYFTRFTYLTEAEALDPDNEYFGPYQGLYAVQWGTSHIPPDNPLVWVVIKDALGIKTAKSVQFNCPTVTTTTTQYVPFTTTTSTTPNPSNPYKSYRVNKYICDQDCTPTSYNETITVAQAGVVEIGKYYITSNPNISVLILEQVAWNGTPGNDITDFTAHDFCYEACGYTPTTTTTTTVASASTNTVFAKYDVVPGPAQDVNTVFVKYDVQ
jgi:hypothetical protein